MEYILTKQSSDKDKIIKLTTSKIVSQSLQLQDRLKQTTSKIDKLEVDLEKETTQLNELNRTKIQLNKSEKLRDMVVENMIEGVVIQDHMEKLSRQTKLLRKF